MRGGMLSLVFVLALLAPSYATASGAHAVPRPTAASPSWLSTGAAREIVARGGSAVLEGIRTAPVGGHVVPSPSNAEPTESILDADSAVAMPQPINPVREQILAEGSPGPISSGLPPTAVGSTGPTRSAPKPVLHGVTIAPETLTATEFRGLDSNCAYCPYYPPDVQLAAGPGYLVEMVNVAGAIYSKQGTQISVFSLSAWPFYFPSSDWVGDPKVVYDSGSNRWFATMVDFSAGYFEVAISDTSDPTSGWYYYTVAGTPSGDYPDQAILGVSSNVVAVGANDFTISADVWVGGEIWVVNKAQLLSGVTAYYSYWGPSCGPLCTYPGSIHPVRSLSSTTTQYFISSGFGSTSTLTLYSEVGTPPDTVTLSSQSLSIYALTTPPPALQWGSSNTLDTGDGRVLDAVWSNGYLWASLVDACTFTGDPQARSCFRIIELNTAGPTVVIDQDWGNPGVYYLYPALSLDSQGDVTILAGYSSSTEYPGLMVWGQAYNEPNSLEPAAYLAGLAPNGPATYPSCSGVCRYGDYFGASTDTDGTSVWVAGEYGASGTFWSTYVARVKTLPLSTSAVSASRTSSDVGQTVTFSVTPSGGTGAYSYAWSGLPSGCASANQATVACVANAAGASTISATVRDSYGTVVTSSVLLFTVYPDPVVATPTGAPVSGGIDVGQAVTFSVAVSGGSGGNEYSWAGLPGCPPQNLPMLSCNSTQEGTFPVSVSVTDSNGFVASSGVLAYVVLPDPTVTPLALSRTSLDVGQVVNGFVTATGGAGSFTYRWNGLPSGCSSSLASLSCSPGAAGVYNISVTVTDANRFAATSFGYPITVSPRLTVALAADPGDFLEHHSTTLNAVVQGGLSPYSYEWSGLPPGCSTPTAPTNSICSPSSPGTYRVTIIVRDRNGASVNSTMQIVVEASLFGLLPLVEEVALVAVAVIVPIGLAAFLLWRRRRRDQS